MQSSEINQKGLEALDTGNYEEAERLFRKSIDISGFLPEALNNLGLLYIKKNRLDSAKKILNSLLKDFPKYRQVYFNLGLIEYNSEDYKEAAAYFEKGLALQGGPAELYRDLGVLYLKSGEYQRALLTLEHAVSLSGDENCCAVLTASALYGLGNEKKALKKALNVLKEDSTAIDALQLCGRIKFDRGRYDSALNYFSLAHRLEPQRPEFLFNLGLLYAIQGEYDSSLQKLILFSETADSCKSFLEAAKVLGTLRKYEGAREILSGSPDKCDSLPEFLSEKLTAEATVLYESGDFNGVLAAIDTIDGLDLTMMILKAKALIRKGMIEEAGDILKKAAELSPSDTEVLLLLSYVSPAFYSKESADNIADSLQKSPNEYEALVPALSSLARAGFPELASRVTRRKYGQKKECPGIREAAYYYISDEKEQALNKYRSIYYGRLCDDSVKVMMRIGELYSALSEHKISLYWFDKIPERKRGPSYYYKRGLSAFYSGKYRKAERDFRKSSVLTAGFNPEASLMLAYTLAFLGENTVSVKNLIKRTVRMSGNEFNVLLRASEIAADIEELDFAVSLSEKAFSLYENAEAALSAASFMRKYGNLSAAISYYTKVITNDSTNVEAVSGKALCLLELKGPEEAMDFISSFNNLTEIPDILRVRAEVFSEMNKNRKAGEISLILYGMNKKPEDLMASANYFYGAGKTKKALFITDSVEAVAPENPELRMKAAALRFAFENSLSPEEARSGIAKMFYNRAVDAYEAGVKDSAELFYRAAIFADPAYEQPYINLSAFLLEQNRIFESTLVVKRGLRMTDGSTDLYEALAVSLYSGGATDEALKILNRVIKENPESDSAKKMRRMILDKVLFERLYK